MKGGNKIRDELLVEYLRNPDRWINKKAAVRELHEKYANGRFSYRTVTNWLYDRDLLEQIRAGHNL
jgi:hypothetical protein